MRAVALRRRSGAGLLARPQDARRVYAQAFGGPPWSEDASAADGFIRRLSDDASRPEFISEGAFRDDRHLHEVVDAIEERWAQPERPQAVPAPQP